MSIGVLHVIRMQFCGLFRLFSNPILLNEKQQKETLEFSKYFFNIT
jgi:hypothetical protein